jgi:hypothetical protein
MLNIFQRFDKQCSCHFHGAYVGIFWKPYILIEQAARVKWNLKGVTERKVEQGVIQSGTSTWFRTRDDK